MNLYWIDPDQAAMQDTRLFQKAMEQGVLVSFTADDWDPQHWNKPVDASKRNRITEHVAEIMCKDGGKEWDDLNDGQEFYLMVQATIFLDDWFEADIDRIGDTT